MDDRKSQAFSGRGKWKQHLLGTGLPLENEVAHILNRLDFEVMGEYEYQRPSSARESETFSVDVHAFSLFEDRLLKHWGQLELLVECKHHTQDTLWVFSPHPSDESLIIGVTSVLDYMTTLQLLDRGPLETYEARLLHCVRGDLLWDGGKGGDNRTKHGLHQLWYAIPNLVFGELESQALMNHEEDLPVTFVCPILVTNAELHILKHDTGVDEVHRAGNLAEVATPVDHLIVDRRPSPELRAYCDDLFENGIAHRPAVEQRYDAIQEAAAPHGERLVLPFTHLPYQVCDMCQKVLVIRLGHFETWVKGLQSAIKTCARGVKRVAHLERDDKRGRARVVPLEDNPGR